MGASQLRRPDLKAVEGVTHSRKVYTLTKNTLTNKIIYDIMVKYIVYFIK